MIYEKRFHFSFIGFTFLQLLYINEYLIKQKVPLATEPGWLADRCSLSQQFGTLKTHTSDTFLFISHTMNIPLFKFRCNIFIGVRIIKEMSGSVASGTHCTIEFPHHLHLFFIEICIRFDM
jgi:hypothetical protein